MATGAAASTDRERAVVAGRRASNWLGGAARSAGKYDVHLNGLAGITVAAPTRSYDPPATVETSRSS